MRMEKHAEKEDSLSFQQVMYKNIHPRTTHMVFYDFCAMKQKVDIIRWIQNTDKIIESSREIGLNSMLNLKIFIFVKHFNLKIKQIQFSNIKNFKGKRVLFPAKNQINKNAFQ